VSIAHTFASDSARKALSEPSLPAHLPGRAKEAARSIAAVELVPFLSHPGLVAGTSRRNAGFPPELVTVPQEELSGDRFHKLETRRLALEETAARLNAQPLQPPDPVEAYCAGRTEPTQKWLREHRDWVVDPTKNARLTSAHYAAVAEGLEPDTDRYFEHVEKAIGLRDGAQGRGNGGEVTIRKAKPGEAVPAGAHKMTRGEYESATDGTLKWGYDDPRGKFKKDDPIGVKEYIRRKQELKRQGRYDKLESY
jgi:hypothetical protein